MAVRFFSDGVSFQIKEKRKISQWLRNVATAEGKKTGHLSFIFVSDEIICDLHQKFLQHDDYTDVITFDNSDGDTISGEMYVGLDTVRFNANDYQVDFRNELLRVMVHGTLHLCGYKDKTTEEQREMRAAEDRYLAVY